MHIRVKAMTLVFAKRFMARFTKISLVPHLHEGVYAIICCTSNPPQSPWLWDRINERGLEGALIEDDSEGYLRDQCGR